MQLKYRKDKILNASAFWSELNIEELVDKYQEARRSLRGLANSQSKIFRSNKKFRDIHHLLESFVFQQARYEIYYDDNLIYSFRLNAPKDGIYEFHFNNGHFIYFDVENGEIYMKADIVKTRGVGKYKLLKHYNNTFKFYKNGGNVFDYANEHIFTNRL